jgi:multiple sugar transport system substrate-binding protein
MSGKIGRKHFRQRLDRMIGELRSDIVSGKLPAGAYLPSEKDLEQLYELSNQSVRKGLDVLVQEKRIEKMPRIGNRVVVPPTGQRTVVRFGYHSTSENDIGIFGLLELFHARYPHIQIQPVALPASAYYTFVKEHMEADMLDVITINDINLQELIQYGADSLLEPIDVHPDTYPFLLPLLAETERPLVQPLLFSPVVLCYNREHLRERDIPEPDSSWGWADLLRHARSLAVPGQRFGLYFHLLMRNRWPIFLLQHGVAIETDASGTYRVRDRELIESLQIGKQLLAMSDAFPIVLSASDADAEELFLKGKVSMIMTTYFALNELRHADFRFDVAPIPHSREFRTLLVMIGAAVNRHSSNPEAAKLFVDFLRSYDTQLHIRRHTLSIPANRRAAEWNGDEEMYRPSRFGMYREIVPSYRTIGDLQLSYRQLSAMQKEIKLYWTGLLDEEALCRNVERVLAETKQAEGQRA